MARMIGADVDKLDRLAHRFESAADRLQTQAGQVRNGIQVAAWTGPVAGRFRVEWDSRHSVALKETALALRENARTLRQNAAEQRAASDSLSGYAGTRVVVLGMIQRQISPIPQGKLGVWIDNVIGFGDKIIDAVEPVKLWKDFKALVVDGVALYTKDPDVIAASKLVGKSLAVVGLGIGIWDMASGLYQGDYYKAADGYITTGLAAGTLLTLAFFPPAAPFVGAAAFGWGVAAYLSGDTPVTKRVVDAGKSVVKFANDVGQNIGHLTERATMGAANFVGRSAQGVSNFLGGARRVLG